MQFTQKTEGAGNGHLLFCSRDAVYVCAADATGSGKNQYLRLCWKHLSMIGNDFLEELEELAADEEMGD